MRLKKGLGMIGLLIMRTIFRIESEWVVTSGIDNRPPRSNPGIPEEPLFHGRSWRIWVMRLNPFQVFR